MLTFTNNLKSTLTQGYDKNKFINYYIDICEFNDKKLKIEESRKYWDEEKNDFSNGVIVNDDVIGEKFLYSYKNNKLESIYQLLWNEKSNSYENHKLTYIYFK